MNNTNEIIQELENRISRINEFMELVREPMAYTKCITRKQALQEAIDIIIVKEKYTIEEGELV